MISKITPDRSKIVIEREDHVKYWTRHFGVTKDELARAIETVGNSAAAVWKQLSVLETTYFLKDCLRLRDEFAQFSSASRATGAYRGAK